MQVLLCLTFFIGLAVAEDFRCYSCKNSSNPAQWIDCGDSDGTLEKCGQFIHTCMSLRFVDKNDKTLVPKGCIPSEEPTFGDLSSTVTDVIIKAISDIEIDGCLDIHFGEAIKANSTLCFCSTSKCNGNNESGANGLEIISYLLVFGAISQYVMA